MGEARLRIMKLDPKVLQMLDSHPPTYSAGVTGVQAMQSSGSSSSFRSVLKKVAKDVTTDCLSSSLLPLVLVLYQQ